MEGKKKRKNYFSNQGNDYKRKRLSLEPGMRGFLCTCNFREKECVREAYNLLEEYSDKICALDDEQSNTLDTETAVDASKQSEEVKKEEENESKSEEKEIPSKEPEENKEQSEDNKAETETKAPEKEEMANDNDNEDDEDEDISTAFNKEINNLKAEAGKPLSKKKFQVVDTGVSNVVFIKSTVPDPLELVTAIVKDLHETKKQKARYMLRMLPISIVCKAYIDDIKVKADPLLERYFAQEPKTFAIVFNRHSNHSLHRNDVIEDLAKIILKKNPANKANLKNPDIAVVVEVIRAVCLISIAPQYFTYKKYNLLEICNQK
ncbi:hypothetical protein TSAR_003265 [Trichomalopsis sarcophagae]|uniref:THUMP domain-containing protein n=1 Tax=Trichomalopsis sarcophagae TaxID=543379 RepID=A0A232F2D5_9HYME|nr:hypothetical protein TSAR_003265 [Trichomalopsis sarcophagae]